MTTDRTVVCIVCGMNVKDDTGFIDLHRRAHLMRESLGSGPETSHHTAREIEIHKREKAVDLREERVAAQEIETDLRGHPDRALRESLDRREKEVKKREEEAKAWVDSFSSKLLRLAELEEAEKRRAEEEDE